MSCVCPCENIKFGCASNEPEFTIGKCVFPSAMSLDLNIQSRSDCLFYKSQCETGTEVGARYGYVDCYDRQAKLDAFVNGTYILTRTGAEDVFSYRFSYEPEPIDVFNCHGTCSNCHSDAVIITATATRCINPVVPYGAQKPQYNSYGLTGYLSITYPTRHKYPSTFPTIISHTNNGVFIFGTEQIIYSTNDPIPCSGAVSFILSFGAGDFGLAQDITARNNQTTIYQPTITLTPVV